MLETERSGFADGVGVACEGKRGDRKDSGLVCQSNQKNRVMARENCGSSRFEDKSQEFGLGQVTSEMPSRSQSGAVAGRWLGSPELPAGVMHGDIF